MRKCCESLWLHCLPLLWRALLLLLLLLRGFCSPMMYYIECTLGIFILISVILMAKSYFIRRYMIRPFLGRGGLWNSIVEHVSQIGVEWVVIEPGHIFSYASHEYYIYCILQRVYAPNAPWIPRSYYADLANHKNKTTETSSSRLYLTQMVFLLSTVAVLI